MSKDFGNIYTLHCFCTHAKWWRIYPVLSGSAAFKHVFPGVGVRMLMICVWSRCQFSAQPELDVCIGIRWSAVTAAIKLGKYPEKNVTSASETSISTIRFYGVDFRGTFVSVHLLFRARLLVVCSYAFVISIKSNFILDLHNEKVLCWD